MRDSVRTASHELSQQQTKANQFRALHRGPRALLLPNAWDVASARIVEAAGFPAVATSSAGVAFMLGYPDGEKIPRAEMLDIVRRIARAVRVPVTADLEAGYGERPEAAALTARGAIEAGAVGLNFEDGTDDPQHPLADLARQLERIAAIREEADDAEIPLVINARTDVFLLDVGPPESPYDEAMRRAHAFKEAGADCVFVPGLRDPELIRRFAAELNFPLNILAGPGSPSATELEKMGVARVSLGSGPMRAGLGLVKRVVEELKTSGTYHALEGSPSHAEVNRLMAGAQ
jgi:2-methylisocitrate lyase-like PEP mutase family enzyme